MTTNADLIMRIEVLEKQVALLLQDSLPNTPTSDSVTDTTKPTKKTKTPKTPKTPKTKETSSDDEQPKKKRTSGYLVFSKAMRDDAVANLSAHGATYKNQDVMTELGAMWKALADEDKEAWNTQAKSASDSN